MTPGKLTVPEKLLVASFEVRKRRATFSAEDLIVEAWKLYPDTFGLSGFSDKYPDSNRVLTNIMGTKGMRGKGWLRKVGEKQYRLTSAGLHDVEAIIQGMESDDCVEGAKMLRAELDRATGAALARIASTTAAKKAFSHQSDEISFNDACGFWDITVRSNANTLQSRLADVSALLERATFAMGSSEDNDGLSISGTLITKYQLATLVATHRSMQERFKTELDFIRRRMDERSEKRPRSI